MVYILFLFDNYGLVLITHVLSGVFWIRDLYQLQVTKFILGHGQHIGVVFSWPLYARYRLVFV